jgi:tetratricopeptide (TPR) repeat protein
MDPDLWLERGRCYTELKKWDESAADFASALEKLNIKADPWYTDPKGIPDQLAQNEELFSRAIKLRPKDRSLWIAKVRRLASQGKWRDAKIAVSRAIEIDPTDHYAWYSESVIRLETGDVEGYKKVCQEMLRRFGQSKETHLAERTAKTCLLIPDAVPDLKPVVQLAELAITGTEKNNNYKWYLLARGMADYRMGDLQTAINRLQKSLTPERELLYLDSIASLFIAMAQHKLGKPDEARQTLFKTFTLADQKFPKLNASGLGEDWADWLRFQIVRREAEALILRMDAHAAK